MDAGPSSLALMAEGGGDADLREEDVPSPALDGWDPNLLTIPQLKRWPAMSECTYEGEKGRPCNTVSNSYHTI